MFIKKVVTPSTEHNDVIETKTRNCMRGQIVGMATSAACEYGAEEQTDGHVVLHCPNDLPLHGVLDPMVLDDQTLEWLLNTCYEI